MTFAVIRIRGTVDVRGSIAYTLKLLRLTRANHCVLIPNTTYYRGMLQKVKDYVTWGEVDEAVLKDLIKVHGRLIGDKPLTDEYIKQKTKFASLDLISKAIMEEKIDYKDIPDIKPLFRLPPPKKGGYEGIKRSYRVGGALGYREKDINLLLRRMI
jgi:large subunit ribosomal protein L30